MHESIIKSTDNGKYIPLMIESTVAAKPKENFGVLVIAIQALIIWIIRIQNMLCRWEICELLSFAGGTRSECQSV